MIVISDSLSLRGSIRRAVDLVDDLEVVRECAGYQALEQSARDRIDLVLIDTADIPAAEVRTVVEYLRALPGSPYVALLATEVAADAALGLRSGAHGVLTKDMDPVDFVRALQLVASGCWAVSAATARLAPRGPVPAGGSVRPRERIDSLTERERQVLALVAQGLSNGEVGRRLFVSPDTVKEHVSRILVKLGVANRIQAAVVAARYELVEI
ncbi:LuxR C-terminal-related transcriptional regulator [Streptomyces sp. NPDC015131]|uniref:LuxR C-terminal-related transcriptional regulator n=1 Tax=Streptomyces sp. NPDC015131 TaxID=3364941 RepID=UPI003701A536